MTHTAGRVSLVCIGLQGWTSNVVVFMSTSMGDRETEVILRFQAGVHEMQFPKVVDPRSGFCFLPEVYLFSLGLISVPKHHG